jgi:phage-related protein (TIGR01555 family)
MVNKKMKIIKKIKSIFKSKIKSQIPEENEIEKRNDQVFSVFFNKKTKQENFFNNKELEEKTRAELLAIAINNNFRRNASNDIQPIKITNKDGLVVAMDSRDKTTALSLEQNINIQNQNSFASMQNNQIGYSIQEFNFFAKQSFIGWQTCAILSQHWLIDKACSIPAQDCVRNGYEITVNDGTEVPLEALDKLKDFDKKFDIHRQLVEVVRNCDIFGIRLCLFIVESKDPKYYEKIFNIDGITPGSYKGIKQVDPYWCTPSLESEDVTNPGSLNFYNPTYWIIAGKRYHRSHLVVITTNKVPDILKPTYYYGGVPKTQQIFERVYQAEYCANDASKLMLSKRAKIYKTDLKLAVQNQADFQANLQFIANTLNNYSYHVVDKESDDIQHIDTALSDVDKVIMNNYQLVAASANVPAVKLMGSEPTGFQSSGSYSENSYKEYLTDLRVLRCNPVLHRHHLLTIKSEILPEFGIKEFSVDINWNPLDELTSKEQAEINKIDAETDSVLVNTGIIMPGEARKRLINDPDSGFNGIEQDNEELNNKNENEGENEIEDLEELGLNNNL